MKKTDFRNYLSELIGTMALVATVVGTGFMTENLGADPVTSLLANALATGAVLVVLIYLLGPFSGAHLNPAVSFALLLRKKLSARDAAFYVMSQLLGALAGALLANAMFEKALVTSSAISRSGFGQWLGELVATSGLVFLILVLAKRKQGHLIAPAVALWIVAGYFFTSSTSFANPAATFGRALTQSPVGIAWDSVTGFVIAQFLGAILAVGLFNVFKALRKNGK